MFHRGPADEDGCYFFRSGAQLMANRRLSIVGLADGRQPMHNEVIALGVGQSFNGELIRLISGGSRPSSTQKDIWSSDTL